MRPEVPSYSWPLLHQSACWPASPGQCEGGWTMCVPLEYIKHPALAWCCQHIQGPVLLYLPKTHWQPNVAYSVQCSTRARSHVMQYINRQNCPHRGAGCIEPNIHLVLLSETAEKFRERVLISTCIPARVTLQTLLRQHTSPAEHSTLDKVHWADKRDLDSARALHTHSSRPCESGSDPRFMRAC